MSSEPSFTFGAQLHQFRLAAGLSREELAERTNLSARSIEALERDERRVLSERSIDQLGRALVLSVADRARLESVAPRRRHRATLAPPSPHAPGVPASLTSFVGRERELAEVTALLATTRLLTLTGTGGVGKTRLALELARRVALDYPDGLHLVELAAVADPGLTLAAIARVLGARERNGRTLIEGVNHRIAARQILLIVDNCEHLLDTCAALAEALLRACPHLRILITSREPLRLVGEVAWRVPSLSTPDLAQPTSPDDLVDWEAVRLFRDRAAAVQPTFAVSAMNMLAVAHVCRRLDGLPLAIELAAARVSFLSVEQIATRLDDRFRLLTDGSRTALPRQQTLRQTLDWSHELLAEPEQVVFRRLAVFASGWTLDAAEAVCSGDGIAPDDVLDLVGRLVDQSLVQCEFGGDSEPRYRLLETVRQYAWETLVGAEEIEVVRRRHAEHYLALVEAAAPQAWGPEQVVWVPRLTRAHDNLRLALGWAEERGEIEVSLRLGVALYVFWQMISSPVEGKAWLLRALMAQSAHGGVLAPAMKALRSRALLAAGVLAWRAFEPGAGQTLFEEALGLAREVGDERAVANIIKNLGISALYRDDWDRARTLLEQGLVLGRAVDDPMVISTALLYLGHVHWHAGDLARARACMEEGLAISRQSLGPALVAGALDLLAMVALAASDRRTARDCLVESLRLALPIDATPRLIEALTCWACLEVVEARPTRALLLAGAAAAANEALVGGNGIPCFPSHVVFDSHVAQARGQAGAAADAAWAAGQALPLEEAIAEALASALEPALDLPGPLPGSSMSSITSLTPREAEVLGLVARGATDQAIAAALCISVKTVHKHVASVLAKTGSANRTMAAAFALQHDAAIAGVVGARASRNPAHTLTR